MKKFMPVLILVAFLIFLFVGVKYVVEHSVKVTGNYCVESRFQQMPDDDERLVEWLKVQPGVVSQVHVRRFGNLVEVGLIIVRSMAGDPPFPNLDAKCAELGYLQPDAPFRDCENRNR